MAGRDAELFNLTVPELHDIPNITAVSDVLLFNESIMSGFTESMNATVSGNTLTLTPVHRDVTAVKRKTTYEGLSYLFVAPTTVSSQVVNRVVISELGTTTHVIAGDTSMVQGEASAIIQNKAGAFNMITYHVSKESKTIKDMATEATRISGVANTGVSKADTAQARADSAYALAGTMVVNDGANGYKTGKEIETRIKEAVAKCPYRVGDILHTTISSNPSVTWIGTTWEKLENRFLIGASSTYGLNTGGGATNYKISVANMPAHNHKFSATTGGGGHHSHTSRHRHLVDSHAHTQPSHKHSATTHDSGDFGGFSSAYSQYGTRRTLYTSSAGGENTGSSRPYTDYQNAPSNTVGDHTHAISATMTNTGSGSDFTVLNPYLAVNIWKRLT